MTRPAPLPGRALPRLALAAALAAGATACTPPQVRYETVAPEPSANEPAQAILYLVGDAGEANPERADVLSHLGRDLGSTGSGASTPVYVAFLGDNIYDMGLPSEPSEEDLENLGGQVMALRDHPGVAGVFLPGNHDWANGGSVEDGRAAIARQGEWVQRALPERDIRFLPDDGCPGPVGLDVGTSIHLVFLDTEWLLRGPEDDCGSADGFYARLAEHLRSQGDRRVIVMAHHPLVSGGPHGGNIAPLERGPFVYYLASKSGASIQDISSRRYSTMVRRIREAIAESGTRPLAFAAGHDHTLQVIGMSGAGTPAYQLVSGAGSKSERTKWVPGMRYAAEGYGYMRLDFRPEEVVLSVFAREVGRGPVHTVFRCMLSVDGTSEGCPEAPRAMTGR